MHSVTETYETRHINTFVFLQQPIHDLAVQAVAKAEFNEVVLALKVLGNAGHPASIKTIIKLLPCFGSAAAAANVPRRVQVTAILALRNIAKREPKMVRLRFYFIHQLKLIELL